MEYQLDKCDSIICVAEKSVDATGIYIYQKKNVWGYSTRSGNSYIEGNTKKISERLKDGDKVTMVFNKIIGQIFIIVNYKDVMVVAKSNKLKNGSFKPVVSLWGSKITVLKPSDLSSNKYNSLRNHLYND